MRRSPRLIVHPGFHLTGHAEVASFVAANAAALADVTLIPEPVLGPALALCRKFARFADPVALANLAEALPPAFAGLPADKDILISAEDLCGAIPGIRVIRSYAAMPALLSQIDAILAALFPAHDLIYALTTQSREKWLFNAYRHHLAQRRLVLTRSEFETLFQSAADHAVWVDRARDALRGRAVLAFGYDDLAAHPLGVGGGFLDKLDLLGPNGAAKFMPAAPLSDDRRLEVWPALLRLNRRTKSEDRLKQLKSTLLAGPPLSPQDRTERDRLEPPPQAE